MNSIQSQGPAPTSHLKPPLFSPCGYDVNAAGKSIPDVLKFVQDYLRYKTHKFLLAGGENKSFEDGKPCVQPSYKLPFDQEPTNAQQKQLNFEATDLLGKFCKSGRCYYDYSSQTFLCRTSSIQPMIALIAILLLLTFSLLNYQY